MLLSHLGPPSYGTPPLIARSKPDVPLSVLPAPCIGLLGIDAAMPVRD